MRPAGLPVAPWENCRTRGERSRSRSRGGDIFAHLVGRAVAGGGAIHTTVLFVINDDGVRLVKRPQDFADSEVAPIVELGRSARMQEWYARGSVAISDQRLDVPRQIPFVPCFNQWSANVPGSTYFL